MSINETNRLLLPKQTLINIDLSIGSYDSFTSSIIKLAKNRTSSYVCVANVHMLIEAFHDPTFKRIVNQSDICTPDGMPLVWGLKLINGIKQDRVAGMDLLPDLLKQAEMQCIPIYIYGGSVAMLDKSESFIRACYPQLKIAGLHSPPFRPLTPQEYEEDATRINQSRAGLVLVALGCPKQERWMSTMKSKLDMPAIGIGGALPVMIGMQSRAPKWVQKSGLEWMFRLSQEPSRLFKRYLVTNTKFIYLFIRELIIKRFS